MTFEPQVSQVIAAQCPNCGQQHQMYLVAAALHIVQDAPGVVEAQVAEPAPSKGQDQ